MLRTRQGDERFGRTTLIHGFGLGVILLIVGSALPASGLLRSEAAGTTSAAGTSSLVSATRGPSPQTVAVVGDSLIHQSIGEISNDMSSQGLTASVFGDPGRALSAPTIRTRLADVANDPAVKIVVIATASNDNLANAHRAQQVGDMAALAEYRALVESSLATLGDRCIVLVDARDASSPIYSPAYAPFTNGALRWVAAMHANTVIVDWSDISRQHTGDWFVADKLHFANPGGHQVGGDRHDTGAAAYAGAIAAGVAKCSATA